MLDVKYVTFSGTGSWTFVTGFRLHLYKSNRNQLSGLPSLPLGYWLGGVGVQRHGLRLI